jgi:hemerythrin-like domain-containing protein
MTAHSTIDFRTPAAGFDQPLAMWLACHERVARMTGLLARLREHLQTQAIASVNAADTEAQHSATSIRRYFDEAAPRHHDDEEVDLFPAVLRRLAAGGDAARLARVSAAIERLQQDHAEINLLWSHLREQLVRVERGEPAQLDATEVAQFVERYRAHIALEETEVSSAAHAMLTAEDLGAIGQAMAARRGVDWHEITSSGVAGERSSVHPRVATQRTGDDRNP